MSDTDGLGAFLRSRREQLRPADVGLPDSGRRRTPGLRREEVATLAGVSIDYLVRLEQGRDRNPSAAVVLALADALLLHGPARTHLKMLSKCESDVQLCEFGDTALVDDVPDTTRAVLDRLEPTPAVVLGPWYQVAAHNPAWARMMEPLGALDGDEPNLARFTFLDDRARAVYPDWEATADEQVAVLRDAAVRWRSDDRLEGLLDELRAAPEFDVRWRRHPVARRQRGSKRIVHPTAGELRIDYEALGVGDDTDQRLIVWLPADEATESALRALATPDAPHSPARLRVVGR